MHEVKLRGWDYIGKKWIYANGYYYDGVNYWFILPSRDPNMGRALAQTQKDIVESASMGQFAGILDKNGVEVYEGDVVKGSHPVMSRTGHIDGSVRFIGVVGYDSRWGGFRRQGINQYQGLSAALMHGKELEVIGNIHEHPELLNP